MAHILIADDDELIAELASQVLIDAGHACGWVTSGEDCWALLRRRRGPHNHPLRCYLPQEHQFARNTSPPTHGLEP